LAGGLVYYIQVALSRAAATGCPRTRLESTSVDQETHDESVRNPTSADVRILQSLRRITRAITIHSRKLSSEYNITTSQLVTLHCILDYGPLTISQIGQRVHLSNSTLVGVIDRLEAKGLVVRERSRQDRRHILISATAEGEELARKAPSPLQDRLAKALSELEKKEQVALSDSLERIVRLMEVEGTDTDALLDVPTTWEKKTSGD